MTYGSATKVVLIGKESTWGTAVTADKDIGIIRDQNDSLAREVKQSMGLGSPEVQQQTTGLVEVNDDTTLEFQHGRILEYVLGSVTHAETTSDWKHTYGVSSNPPSFTKASGENLSSDTNLTGAGFKVESAEISQTLNDVIIMKVTSKGKTTTSSTSTGAAVISSLPVFPLSWTTITINGTSADEVQDWNIKITKKLNTSGGMNSNLIRQMSVDEIHFEFSAKLGFTNDTYQKLFLGGTTPSETADPSSFDFQINSNNGVTLGSGRRELHMKLTGCQAKTWNKAASVGNMVYMEIAGEGTFSEAYSVDNISDTSW